MKLLIILLLSGVTAHSQFSTDTIAPLPANLPSMMVSPNLPVKEKTRVKSHEKWKMTGNLWLTGALVFTAGASKGLNETLMFHWKVFHQKFPKANPNWFNPNVSWKNKYKNGDPNAGAKFPLSTSVLVAVTDQYHLNNFINRAAWGTALVIKIGEGKKSLKHYLIDLLYYSVCHQAGFAMTYYPFKNYKGN